jgi:hypothetical protein
MSIRFAPRLSYFFDIHNDFFEEIAKLRAARRIWARHMKERYGAKDPRSWMLRFHSQTAGVTLTAQQPMNNIVRVAYQALAAVLGGTQSLHTELDGRDAGAADGRGGAGGPAHAAAPRLRERRAERDRSVRRFVLRRGARREARARSRGDVREIEEQGGVVRGSSRGGSSGASRSRPRASSGRSSSGGGWWWA